MKGLVESLGLKGAIIFASLIIIAPKLEEFYPFAGVVAGIIGCILFFVFLEEYFKVLRETVEHNILKNLSADIKSCIDLQQSNATSIITNLSDSKNLLLETMYELENDRKSDTQNIFNGQNRIENTISSNAITNLNTLNEYKKNIVVAIKDTQEQIQNDLIAEFSNVREKIAADNNIAAMRQAKSLDNYEVKLEKQINNLKDDIKTDVKRVVDNSAKNIDTSLDAKVNEMGRIVTSSHKTVVDELGKNVVKMLEIQQKNNAYLSENVGEALAGIDENTQMFRDCLEDNLKRVIQLSDESEQNKTQVLDGITEHNLKIKKLLDAVSMQYEQEFIEEKDNGTVVVNTKKNGLTIQSEMREDNKLVFLAGYQDGKVIFTKSFDDNGNLISEVSYYSNGQIKERKTYRNYNGKINVELERF